MSKAPLLAVIDDDDIFQVIARKMLENCAPHWQIISFYNGQEAIQYFSKPDDKILPDVILLDINMPVMDGWMFLEEFKQLKAGIDKDIKIYLTSSSIDSKDISRGKNNPQLTDYIIKPLTVDTVNKITSL